MSNARIAGLVLAGALFAVMSVQFVRAAGPAVTREQHSRVNQACAALDPTPRNAKLGRLPVDAPDIQAQDYTGKMVPLSAYRGKVVMLNFWASWCPPCVEEMPSMDRLARLFGTDLVILAVSSDESWDKIREFFPNGTAMTVLWDPSAAADTEDAAAGALSRAYGTDKLPETYLIDREGKIRYYVVNTRNWSSPDAQRCIRALLKE
jgi:thiol-disulfide isomerase/thioredoxin